MTVEEVADLVRTIKVTFPEGFDEFLAGVGALCGLTAAAFTKSSFMLGFTMATVMQRQANQTPKLEFVLAKEDK